MNWLKFETPTFVYLGPFMNSDGITVNTGLSLSQGDIFITRNGGAFFSLVDASAIVHSMLGYYRVPLGSTDLGSTGRLKMVCNKATALPVWESWSVVTSKVYDSIITGSDNLEVDTVQISGDSTPADNAELFFDGTGYNASNSAIGTVATATNVTTVNGLANDVITAASVHDAGSFVIGALSITNQLDAGNVVVDSTAAITGELSVGNGVVVTCSTGGKSAAKFTGGAASGIGIEVIGTGTGQGVSATGGATSGTGVSVIGGAPNGVGLYVRGDGSGSGIRSDGGDGDGVGVLVNGGATNGNAVTLTKAGSGYDLDTDIHGTIDTASAVTTVNGLAASVVTAASIATNAITSDELATSAIDEIVDAVWDEVLTAATHNVASSAGRRLRTLDSNEMRAGTCQAGSTANTIRLDAGASATDGWYDPAVVIIDGGTGAGQCRLVIDYVGSTQTCYVNRDWRLAPDGTSTFIIVADSGLDCINEGQAAGGGASSITLNTHAKNISDTYNGCTVVLTSGTGRGQSRVIIDYDGGTKVALVSEPWITQPISGTGYYVYGYGRTHLIPDALTDIRDTIIDDATRIDASALNTLSGHDPGETIMGATDTVNATVTSIGNDVITGASMAASAGQEIADYVWDEVLTAATHNIATSAGRRVREKSSDVILTGTSPNSGGTTNTSTCIELDASASAVDGAYDPSVIVITEGTGAGQCRNIYEYRGATKIAYVSRDWKVTPDNTSVYCIIANPGDSHVNEGPAQAGSTANTIVLNTLASNVNDAYKNQIVFISAGTGADQAKMITAYNGTTKVATVDSNWTTTPDVTSIYAIYPYYSAATTSTIADAVWDELIAGHAGAGSAGLALSSASAPTVGQIADAVWDEDATGHIAANSVGFYMRAAYSLAAGRLRIDDVAKQLVLYMPDGVTEIARWNIYNSAGALASTNVFDRQRV